MPSKSLTRDLDLFDLPREGMRSIDALPRAASPPIPVAVPCVSMWRVWASLVAEGWKGIETRVWPLLGPATTLLDGSTKPGAPTWLALHTAQKNDGKIEGADRPDAVKLLPAGVVFALVLVDEVRPMRPDDVARAGVYRPDLYAWQLARVVLLEPFLARARGFQKLGKLEGRVLEQAARLRLEPKTCADWKRSEPGSWPIVNWDSFHATAFG
jgi:hypothetical protein